jgi:hypothetical protein
MPNPHVRLRPRRNPTVAAGEERPDSQAVAGDKRSKRRARPGEQEARADRRPVKPGAQQAHDWLDREIPAGASQPATAIAAAAAATGIEEKHLKRARKLLKISLVPEPDGSWTWARASAGDDRAPEGADPAPPPAP